MDHANCIVNWNEWIAVGGSSLNILHEVSGLECCATYSEGKLLKKSQFLAHADISSMCVHGNLLWVAESKTIRVFSPGGEIQKTLQFNSKIVHLHSFNQDIYCVDIDGNISTFSDEKWNVILLKNSLVRAVASHSFPLSWAFVHPNKPSLNLYELEKKNAVKSHGTFGFNDQITGVDFWNGKLVVCVAYTYVEVWNIDRTLHKRGAFVNVLAIKTLGTFLVLVTSNKIIVLNNQNNLNENWGSYVSRSKFTNIKGIAPFRTNLAILDELMIVTLVPVEGNFAIEVMNLYNTIQKTSSKAITPLPKLQQEKTAPPRGSNKGIVCSFLIYLQDSRS